MKTEHLNKWQDEFHKCIRCAYCFEGCPVFKDLGWDSNGARGRVIMSYGLLSGDLEPSQYIADKLFQCTFCKDCTERCSAGVNAPEIVAAARADLVKAGFALDTHKYMVKNVQETGNIFGDTETIIPVQKGNYPLFVGCQYLSRPNQTKKYIKILEKLGIKPQVYEEICCGFPMKALGFDDDFKEHKNKFTKSFSSQKVMALCPTCSMFMKEEYGMDVQHILQVIAEKIPSANLDMKVTYHDPCDLSRGMKIIDEPRKILKKLGVEVVEMKNSKLQSRCCGGGGGILMSDSALSNRIAKKRIEEAIETGADTLVTPCPTCEQVLKKAAQEISESDGKPIAVRNLVDLIWKGVKKNA